MPSTPNEHGQWLPLNLVLPLTQALSFHQTYVSSLRLLPLWCWHESRRAGNAQESLRMIGTDHNFYRYKSLQQLPRTNRVHDQAMPKAIVEARRKTALSRFHLVPIWRSVRSLECWGRKSDTGELAGFWTSHGHRMRADDIRASTKELSLVALAPINNAISQFAWRMAGTSIGTGVSLEVHQGGHRYLWGLRSSSCFLTWGEPVDQWARLEAHLRGDNAYVLQGLWPLGQTITGWEIYAYLHKQPVPPGLIIANSVW